MAKGEERGGKTVKDYDAQFWKNEYERLRRNRKKEIEHLRYQTAVFSKKTWDLLHLLGMKDKEIMEYYGRESA